MKVVSIKAPEKDLARWKEAAHDERISLSEWIRRRCDTCATATSVSTVTPEPKEILPILKQIVSPEPERRVKPSECFNRLPKGSYCKACGTSH